ncbi:helix-turn-helix transcriptional regulator [Actinoplanes sp. NPDC049596]|uniref:helix-turn-helix transcriptional regulator n=1 Tax=unclassified Actinoplanes TaxID=2626549 RepID=UPI00342E2F56
MHARSQLLPLLRSPLAGELLAWLYLHPEESYPVSELAQRLWAAPSAIGREADRLTEAGLLHQHRRGNLRLLRAKAGTAVTRPLTDLLALAYGPAPILTDLLAPLPGVDAAYLHGSWAARHTGEPGPPPADVHVLVIGSLHDDDLDATVRAAERRLARAVTITHVSQARWHSAADDPLLTLVRSQPLFPLLPAEGL